MKKSELNEELRRMQKLAGIIEENSQEGIKSLLKENTGLITFEQLKQACIESFEEYLDPSTDDSEIYDELMGGLDQATNIDELVNMLDGRGLNGYEAYDFIFSAILK
jgi:hypothetical protein